MAARWQKDDQFVAVFRYPQCTADGPLWFGTSILTGYEVSWGAAWRKGLEAQGTDDFNIAVIRKGEVVDLLWHRESIGEEPDVLVEYASEIKRHLA